MKDLVWSSASVTAAVRVYKSSAARLWPTRHCASAAEISIKTLRENHFGFRQKPDLGYGRDWGTRPFATTTQDASARIWVAPTHSCLHPHQPQKGFCPTGLLRARGAHWDHNHANDRLAQWQLDRPFCWQLRWVPDVPSLIWQKGIYLYESKCVCVRALLSVWVGEYACT